MKSKIPVPVKQQPKRKNGSKARNPQRGPFTSGASRYLPAIQFTAPPGTTATPVMPTGPIYTSASNGDVRIQYEEEWNHVGFDATGKAHFVDSNTTFLSFAPGSSLATRLDTLGGLWELYRVNKVCIIFRTSSGTTTNGNLIFGADYDPTDIVASGVSISTLVPRMNTPVWASASMALSPDRCMKKRWMHTTNGPGTADSSFAISLGGNGTANTTVGVLWVCYDLTFTSPVNGMQTLGLQSEQRYSTDGATVPTMTPNSGNQVMFRGPGSENAQTAVGTDNISIIPDGARAQLQWRPNIDPGPGVYRLTTTIKNTNLIIGDPEVSAADWNAPALHHTFSNALVRTLDTIKEISATAASSLSNVISTVIAVPGGVGTFDMFLRSVSPFFINASAAGIITFSLTRIGGYNVRQIDAQQ